MLCSGLTSLTIPDRVTYIDGAFHGCTGLGSVTEIGSGLTVIDDCDCLGGWGFSGWINLTNITVNPLNAAFSSRDGVLLNKAQDLLILYPGGRRGHYSTDTRQCDVVRFGVCRLSGPYKPDPRKWHKRVAGQFPRRRQPDEYNRGPAQRVLQQPQWRSLNKSLDTLIACPKARSGTLMVPDGVTSVSEAAFLGYRGRT